MGGYCEDLFAFGGGVGTGHQEPAVAEWFLSCLILFVYCIADEGDFICNQTDGADFLHANMQDEFLERLPCGMFFND